ncbi:hypothetical protein CDES_01575 [Corynebacterium deserti GIMN1.010]|uniref:Rv3660c-like CheY-like N-terminal domain-containing protein n=1 Tax=Corynebacterium deserti GIMN1.010 TaxID=931089 RepID=A0A0M5IQP3_9CORY|nr:septum site-determining protein Ssd [Corynebacterium deserti]ALC04786.1 hypothetical protein CDES_01575 [Corynebacterium deserti GIMN1.010]
MNSSINQTILVAVEDPVLHPEAMHVAAATGRPIIESTDISDATRHFHRASAVLIDAGMAKLLNNSTRRGRVFFLDSDPGPSNWKAAMAIHAEQALLLPAQAAELLSALGRDNRDVAGGSGHIVGVVGAVGGAGTSTLAAAIAKRRATTSPTVLIDGVPHSGGIDLLLGIEDSPGARWPDVGFHRGTVHATDVIKALPRTPDNVAVLSTARSNIADPFDVAPLDIAKALECFLASDQQVDVVVDLSVGGLVEEVMESLSHLVIVVPAEVRAVAAANALKLSLQQFHTPISVVLRHRGWSGLDVDDVEAILGCDLLTEVGTISKLPKSVELQGLSGGLPKVLASAADAAWAVVA